MENSLRKSRLSQFPEHNYVLRDCGNNELGEADHKNKGERCIKGTADTKAEQSFCKHATVRHEDPDIPQPQTSWCPAQASQHLWAGLSTLPQGQRLSRVCWLNSSLLERATSMRLKCVVSYATIQL